MALFKTQDKRIPNQLISWYNLSPDRRIISLEVYLLSEKDLSCDVQILYGLAMATIYALATSYYANNNTTQTI
jgi:hypothetical protein